LDQADSRIKDLFNINNLFVFNDITNTVNSITTAYQTPSPLITFTNDENIALQAITDANGVENIDGQCSMTVANGVPLVVGTVENYFTYKEGVQNANISGQLFTTLDMNSTSFCKSNFNLLEYSLILGP
jgi:hypothetical protein